MKKLCKISIFILLTLFCFISCQNQTVEDTTPPAMVTELKAKAESGKILLSWKDPADKDLYGIKIYYEGSSGIMVGKGLQKYELTGLENGKSYTFKASAIDLLLNESEAASAEAVVFTETLEEKIVNKTVENIIEKPVTKEVEVIKENIKENKIPKTYASPVTYVLDNSNATNLKVTMNTATIDASIYYTLNGDEPTIESTCYTDQITVTENTVIKAIAVKNGIENSPVSAAEVSIVSREIANAVTFTSYGIGNNRPYVEVYLNTSTSGAKIYYTTDGTNPTLESSLYTGQITFNANTTIKAMAVKNGLGNGPVSTAFVSIATGVEEIREASRLTAGTYTVYHYLQKTTGGASLADYELKDSDSNVTVSSSTSVSALTKSYTGFSVNQMSQKGTGIYLYYNRNIIKYTFDAGENGAFGDGTKTKVISGLYGTAVNNALPVPVSTVSNQIHGKWVNNNKEPPAIFDYMDITFTEKWKRAVINFSNCEIGDIVLENGTIVEPDWFDYEAGNRAAAVIFRKGDARTPALGIGLNESSNIKWCTSEAKTYRENAATTLSLSKLYDGSKAWNLIKTFEGRETYDQGVLGQTSIINLYPAFKYCSEYSAGIFTTGWYMPAVSEFKTICVKNTLETVVSSLKKAKGTEFYHKQYWTCNVVDKNKADVFDIQYDFTTPDDFFCAMDGNNTYAGNPKVVLYPVRPIRAFTDN